MKIGIDARLIDETGVGRYIRNLIGGLALLDKTNEYIVFLRAAAYDDFPVPNALWTKVCADVPWHTISEQLIMPWIFLKSRLDLVHIPYFNVPIFYPGKFIVTIHDLTILHFDTGKATTLPLPLYKLRRLGYFLALAVGLRRAHKIIAVSKTTKQEVVDHFQINPEKIIVTYEGVDNKFQIPNSKFQIEKQIVKNPYFLYVGNAYPHKNLETLLRAFQKLSGQIKLVLVGKDDFFYARTREAVNSMGLSDHVIFYGFADEAQLRSLYVHATALVFPSLMEGFGLPTLEALAVGCPVICSHIAAFVEILGTLPIYFEPTNSDQLAEKMEKLIKSRPSEEWKKEAVRLANNFSWEKMVKETLDAYANTQS